jgi:nucleoside-diphosphate-sugar epimerase
VPRRVEQQRSLGARQELKMGQYADTVRGFIKHEVSLPQAPDGVQAAGTVHRPGKGGPLTAVLVTGASGFIGQALCDALEAQGHQVRRAARKSSDRAQSPALAIENIGPDTNWRAAVTGCDVVVHLAAHVHVMHGGARRFVFLSSVKVNGEASARRPLVEGDPIIPVDAYGASKAEAERRLRMISTETGMEVVVVRPPLVYGPGVKANFFSLLRAVDSRMPLPLLSISNLRSFVYAGNLIHALGVCLAHPSAANQTFFVSDDHDVSTPQLVREIAAALGKRPLLFPFPPTSLRGLGVLTGRSEQVERLTGSLCVDVSSIKSRLGWLPPFTLQQGLAQTASWYRKRLGKH